jgi:coproporphyrinogen III oxidase
VDCIQVLRFRDGRYASFNLTYDRLLFLDPLGLIPASA